MVEGTQIKFTTKVRWWDESSGRGLAVIDVPAELVATLGGRRQYRVAGTIAGTTFSGSAMLVAGGGFCVGVSKAALKNAGASVGDHVDVEIARA